MRFLSVLCIIFLALGVTIIHATAPTRHTCAPAVPPLVPGATLPAQTPGIIVINEVLRTPGAKSAWECMGTVNTVLINPWIELYNPQDQPFDLYGARSSLDSGPQTQVSFLPMGMTIAPHSFLVVFPITAFSAQKATEVMTVRLLMYDTVIDQVSVPPLATDTSYARIPDGSATWSTTAYPTIDASNALAPALLPTPTHTVSGTPDAGSHKNVVGHTNTSGTTSTATGNSAKQQTTTINGIQPAWSAEHFSDPANASTTTARPVVPSSPSALVTAQPTSVGLDLNTKILLTLAAILLAFTVLYIWRLFFKT